MWLFGVRSHHWEWGCALMALGARWIWRDRRDLPFRKDKTC